MNRSIQSKSSRRRYLFAMAFILPAAVFALTIIIYPLLQTIGLSFQNVRFMGGIGQAEPGLTLDNYSNLFASKYVMNALWRSIYFTFLALSASFIIGFGLALLLNKKFRFQKIVRTLLLLAWPIPGVVVSLLFVWMFDSNYGIINNILKSLHLIQENIKWTTSAGGAVSVVINATVWKSYPFFTLTLLAGLKTIPEDLYEAASIDGAGPVRRFIHITLPALRSVIVTSLLLNGLWVFRNFDLVYSITGGGPNRATETLPLILYSESFKYFNVGYGSAIGIVSLLVCTLFVVLAWPSLKKQFY